MPIRNGKMVRRGRHRWNVGVSGRQGPYIKYGYTSASHVPGHYVDRFGNDRYLKVNRNFRTGGFSGIELKFADIETSNDAFAVTWSTMEDSTNDSVSGVAQGDTESSRDGRVYHIHSVHIRANAHVQAIEDAPAPLVALKGRICLILDTQTNGAQLTATDVMDGGQTNDILAFRNLQFTKRFKVLWDRDFLVQRTDQTTSGAINTFNSGFMVTPTMKYNKKFSPPIKVICSTGTTGVISLINDNSLHIIGVGNATALQLDYQCRIRFTG